MILFKLMKYLRKNTIYAVLAPVTVIAEVILEIYIPYLMSKIIDVGVTNSDMGYIFRTGAYMVGFALLSLLFGVLSGRFAAVAATGFAKNIRKALFDKVQDYSFSNIDRFPTATLVTRLTTDVTNTQNAFMMVIRIMFRAPVMLISATLMAVSINKELSLVLLVAIPFIAIALSIIMSISYSRFQKMLKLYDGLNARVQENLIAIRVVKAFVREDFEMDQFGISSETLRKAQVRAEKIIIFNMPILTFAVYACMIAISWLGGGQIIQGKMLTGEFMTFTSYILQILMSLMMISFIFLMLVLSRASVSRINEVLSEKVDITDDDADTAAKVADGSVSFENVDFSYSGDAKNLMLNDISFDIRSGDVVGVIGGTGDGKSTLVQLIPRLYDVTSGSVKVGGRDVKDYTLKALRDSVSIVLQKNVLFSGTIKDNLKWGNENASDDEVIAAAKTAQAHDFIMSFPDGYDTDLGQGGVNVSGGQKQRLCIARALLKKPKILILDDSTSAVDTATDALIREGLKNSFGDTTAIIIAQRITSVMDADKIIILDDGRIDDMGTHEELMGRNEIYKEVFESQQKGA